MPIPIKALRETLATARNISPDFAKATKKTIRVLQNEGFTDSLSGLLKGKPDYNAKATLDDMMFPSAKSPAGYAEDGYSAASMAKLPKGAVSRNMTVAQKRAMLARKRKAGPKGGSR